MGLCIEILDRSRERTHTEGYSYMVNGSDKSSGLVGALTCDVAHDSNQLSHELAQTTLSVATMFISVCRFAKFSQFL